MRPEKIAIVREIRDELSDAAYVFLTDFTGMDTGRTAELRQALKESGSRFQVVPNRLLRVAAEELGYAGLEPALKGPTAMVFGAGDAAAAAKALQDFARVNKMPMVKLGRLEGVVLQAAEVEALASLPAKPVLQGMVVGTLAAPMSNLVSVMNQKLLSLLYVLQAAADKKDAA